MNVRWTVLLAACTAVVHHISVVLDLRLDQVHVAPQIQNNQMQQIENPQFLEQARNFYQRKTYTAASPIGDPSTSCPPTPCVAPQQRSGARAGWSREMIDFFSE